MRYEVIGRGLRALRHRRGWRQRDLADRSGVSRSVVSELERGSLEGHTLGSLVRAAAAVGATLRIDLLTGGADVHRLLDADHARIQSEWAAMLQKAGWDVVTEATFNHFGERGSIDMLAWHPAVRVLLVIEIKTAILDLQDLQAGIDRKTRVARHVSHERGWAPSRTVPFLLVAEGSTSRRRIRDHAPLFRHYDRRGRAALAWLKSPTVPDAPTGVLCLARLSSARSDDRRRAGRQRIRLVPRPGARRVSPGRAADDGGAADAAYRHQDGPLTTVERPMRHTATRTGR